MTSLKHGHIGSRRAERPKFLPVEAPPKLMAGHVADRDISNVAGAPKAWRNTNEHPLSKAYADGKIGTDEFAAGEVYRTFFETMGRTGKDSTQFAIVGGNSGTPWTETQVTAIRTIQQFEDRMNHARSVVIVRKFCGEGYGMTDAAVAAGYPARDALDRLRIALNKLAMAISRTRFSLGRED